MIETDKSTKEEIKKILDGKLNWHSKKVLDVTIDAIAGDIMKKVDSYMSSKEAKDSHMIGLYTLNRKPVKDFVKPGQIYEVLAIEHTCEGEIVLSRRFDFEKKSKKYGKKG